MFVLVGVHIVSYKNFAKKTPNPTINKSPNGLDLWIQIPNVTLPILSNIPPFDLTAGGWSKVTPKDRSHLDMYVIVF